MSRKYKIIKCWRIRALIMLMWLLQLKKVMKLEFFTLPLQICLLRLLWRSLKSRCSALHLRRILPQDWALFPSTTIPEYLELHTVVRSFKQRGEASLLFAELKPSGMDQEFIIIALVTIFPQPIEGGVIIWSNTFLLIYEKRISKP